MRLLIIGAGNHAKVVIDIAAIQYDIVGCVGDKEGTLLGYPVYTQPVEADVCFVAIGDNYTRQKVTELQTLPLVTIVDPSSRISCYSTIGTGSFIGSHVSVGVDCTIGKGCILNTNSHLDHDSVMQEYASLAPGVTVCGSVTIGSRSAICAGVTIIHRIYIGQDTVIGAGSTVLDHAMSSVVEYGTPSRFVRERVASDPYL